MDYFKPYTVLCGSAAGGWSDRDLICGALNHLREYATANDMYRMESDVDALYRELAETNDDAVQWNDFEGCIEAACFLAMPPYCSLQMVDNEYTVMPDIDGAQEYCSHNGTVGDQLPDKPNSGEYLVINERGNCALYENSGCGEWREIWSVV